MSLNVINVLWKSALCRRTTFTPARSEIVGDHMSKFRSRQASVCRGPHQLHLLRWGTIGDEDVVLMQQGEQLGDCGDLWWRWSVQEGQCSPL